MKAFRVGFDNKKTTLKSFNNTVKATSTSHFGPNQKVKTEW